MELRDKNGLTEEQFLAQYTPGKYPRPAVTVDLAVLARRQGALQALLVRYATDAAGTQSETVPIPSTLKGENQIISRAVEYVAEHTGERITVTELARVCCVSPAYLSLLFQRHLGSAPGAYMLRVRLERSRQMIRSGAGSMAQIAQALCFSSAQHFSTAFKRQYGVSPKEYAKGLK